MREEDKRIPEELQRRRSRKKKERNRQVMIYKIMIAAAGVFLVIGVCVVIMGQGKRRESNMEESQPITEIVETTENNDGELKTATPSSAKEIESETDIQPDEFGEESTITDAQIMEILGEYEKPGISNVTDYLNIREEAEETASIIGRLPANGICEVLEQGETWCRIQSEEIEGYVNGNYLLTGEKALERVNQILETQDSLETAVPFQQLDTQ